MRHDNRQADELRPITVQRKFTQTAPGSVLIQAGQTMIFCTASIDETVPPWKNDEENPSGWVTAEYNMLPGSTAPRKRRERSKVQGRTSEIQRLIGRSLRAVVDMEALGPRTVVVDCDVMQADGGTRTLSLTGAFIALVDALSSIQSELSADRPVLKSSVAAVSVGIVDGQPVLDLDYTEDSQAGVDMNVVMTGKGEYVEIQGTAEGQPFSPEQLQEQLELAQQGIQALTAIQQEVLGETWPFQQ